MITSYQIDITWRLLHFFIFFADDEPVGFLAFPTCYICDLPTDWNNLVFDIDRYNYGYHYNTSEGVFEAPVTGLYLVTSRLAGNWNPVDKEDNMIRQTGSDAEVVSVMGTVTAVLELAAGQLIGFYPPYRRTGEYYGGDMYRHWYSWFGVILLKQTNDMWHDDTDDLF